MSDKAKTSGTAPVLAGKHRIATGPLGAVCVAEIAGTVFMEARVSIAGVVIPWGTPVFQVVV